MNNKLIESAIKRRESRGLHYTTDFPQRDDKHYLVDTVLRSFLGKSEASSLSIFIL